MKDVEIATPMRLISILLVVSLAMAGCGGGASIQLPTDTLLPNFVVTGPPDGVISFSAGAPLAVNGTSAVVPLFEFPNIPTNQGQLGLAMWGSKDSAGNITQVSQAQVIINASSSVHIFFDEANHPVLLRDDSSGYSLGISLDSSTQQTFTLCDPSETAVANVVLTIVSGSPQAGPVASGGSCFLARAGSPLITPPGHTARLNTPGVPTNIAGLPDIAKLITAGSYVAGLGFALSAMLRFKLHKDNPTQVPIGKPIALLFIAAALIFLPSLLQTAGTTIFGNDPSAVGPIDGITPFYQAETTLPGCANTPPSGLCPLPNPDPTP